MPSTKDRAVSFYRALSIIKLGAIAQSQRDRRMRSLVFTGVAFKWVAIGFIRLKRDDP